MTAIAALLLSSLLDAAAPSAGNRLGGETSRYLQQHARDPIEWYPWGEAALLTAQKQNKLIFLSIGYSTCQWCHVMASQSFADAGIAAIMNESFIAIKVDREERPDVDSAYMAVARTLMAEPGWPLNLVLTPDGKPFFAAAYLPRDRLALILTRFARTWRDEPAQIEASSAMVAQAMTAPLVNGRPAGADEVLERAFEQLRARFDPLHGGFLPAPKLPAGHQLMFLLRFWRRHGDTRALDMVTKSLDAMSAGNLYDRIGFGFHRYSTDAAWQLPHYEKMLYDQAILAMACLEAYQATGKARYAATAREIFTYVLRDLRSPGGGFFSAQDADERYYRSSDRSALPPPKRDEKIIADWNGLMIASLAHGAAVLGEPSYANRAADAADFILRNLRTADGRLLHQSGREAYLDDYSFIVWGLLNLYEATFETRYLKAAIDLQEKALRRFRDREGRFYVTSDASRTFPIRPRETADGSMPSGQSVQLMNLIRLSRMTGRGEFEEAARKLVEATLLEVGSAPSGSAHFMSGLDFFIGPSFEIVLAGDDIEALSRAVFQTFVPNKVVLRYDPLISRIAPFTSGKKARGGRPTAYVCTDFVCRRPTHEPGELRESLLPGTRRPGPSAGN